jgi:hypothetical protein
MFSGAGLTAMGEVSRRRAQVGRLLLKGKTPAEAAAAHIVLLAQRAAARDVAPDLALNHPAGSRFCYESVDAQAGARGDSPPRRGQIRHVHGWQLLGKSGYSSQKPERQVMERDEAAIARWRRRTWPARRLCRQEGRLIGFIVNSGPSEHGTRVQTLEPVGQTSVIQFHFNWKQVSVTAGASLTHCLLRLLVGPIRSRQIVHILRALRQHPIQRLLMVRYGCRAHRNRRMR